LCPLTVYHCSLKKERAGTGYHYMLPKKETLDTITGRLLLP